MNFIDIWKDNYREIDCPGVEQQTYAEVEVVPAPLSKDNFTTRECVLHCHGVNGSYYGISNMT